MLIETKIWTDERTGMTMCRHSNGSKVHLFAVKSLDMLLMVLRLGGIVDGWEHLPTFGGDPPRHTAMVLSYDAERVLFGTRPEDFAIMSRVEWERWHDTIDRMIAQGYTIDTPGAIGQVVKHFERKADR